jgi:hypothetical protein
MLMRENIEILFILLGGIALVAWGVYDIINKEKLNNRYLHMLAVSRVLGGIIFILAIAIIFRPSLNQLLRTWGIFIK